MFKGAIFDFDGTLVDSLQLWVEVDRRFLAARNLPCTPDYLATIRQLNFLSGAAYTVEHFDLKETPQAVLAEWNALALSLYRTEVDLKPGVEEYLCFLRRKGIRLAIATSSVPALCLPLLKRKGILRCFETVVTAAEVPEPKTEPAVFLRAAADLQLEPKQVVVYEDLAAAVKVAGTAGFYTVGIYDPAAAEEWPTILQEADQTYRTFVGQAKNSPFSKLV